jgi:outer membrane protein OmpA-like peptidoglycan-associated protein
MGFVRWSVVPGLLLTLAACAPQMPPPRMAEAGPGAREATAPPMPLPYDQRRYRPYVPPVQSAPLPPPPRPRMRGRDEARADEDYRVLPRSSARGEETDYDLPDSILFGLDSARISSRAMPALRQIARAARDEPDAHLIVEGHTDTSGTNAHNRELSNDRACAVAAILVREGIAERRIRVIGLGKRGLAVRTADQVREPRNRRVVIRLIHRRGDGR